MYDTVNRAPTKDEIPADGSQEAWVLMQIQVIFRDPILPVSTFPFIRLDPPVRSDGASR